jgi:hypothetical protein
VFINWPTILVLVCTLLQLFLPARGFDHRLNKNERISSKLGQAIRTGEYLSVAEMLSLQYVIGTKTSLLVSFVRTPT